MAARKKRKSDIELKNDLLKEIEKLKQQAIEIDNKRADKIGQLAKDAKITDLDDTTIKKEFEAIYTKYQNQTSPEHNVNKQVKKSGQGSGEPAQNSQESAPSNEQSQPAQNF
jgi:predicted metal-dependent peptidase